MPHDDPRPPPGAPPPRGLVLFPRPTPRRIRRAKLAFALLAAAAALALVWPVYPRFAGIRPLILGLPLSFAWVVAWLVAVFAGLVVLYRVEYGASGTAGPLFDAGPTGAETAEER